jgi:hypothetical protein
MTCQLSDFPSREPACVLNGGRRALGSRRIASGVEWPPVDGTLRWATNEAADDFLWRCTGDPDSWPVIFRARDRREEVYHMGMVEFLLGLVRGDIHPPMGAQLALPADFESWRDERRRLALEDEEGEGF